VNKKIHYSNRRAKRDYFIVKKIEAGVVLTGSEVKAIKTQGINLDQALIQLKDNELYLVNAFIPAYKFATDRPYDPRAKRKLLLKKNQIKTLIAAKQKKLAIVPLSCYNKNGWIKILVGVGRRKKKFEKKQAIIERTLKRKLKEEENRWG